MAQGEVTWHQDLAPIVEQKCNGCHVDGGIAPLSFSTYEEAKMWGASMLSEVESGAMPPWGAQDTDECQPRLPFKDDLRLSEDELALFRQWVEGGLLEGDPAAAAELPSPPDIELDNPTVQLTIPAGVEVSGTQDRFVCFPLDPGVTEKVWLDAVQVTSGNDAIVHHALVYQDPGGEAEALAGGEGYYDCFGGPGTSSPTLVGAWAPGALPTRTPDGVGIPLEPGSKLVMQIHYHPTGLGVETDTSTRVDLRFTQSEPAYVGQLALIGNFGAADSLTAGGEGFGLLPGDDDPASGPAFVIPAGARAHVERQRFEVPGDGVPGLEFSVWAVGSHMHYVGTDMMIDIEHPGAEGECLLQTPAWDFEWQRAYYYDAPVAELPVARPGDILNLRCTYDNSLDNPFVREALDQQGLDAPVDVVLGEETLDEMCLGVFGIAVPAAYASAIE